MIALAGGALPGSLAYQAALLANPTQAAALTAANTALTAQAAARDDPDGADHRANRGFGPRSS